VVPVEDSVGPYLREAAELTRANAEYLQVIQDARLAREKANQEHMRTRRSIIEEAEWERDRAPSPEQVRQEELARALDRARVSPPLTERWSGESLNVLLGHLIARRGRGAPAADVPLDEDTLQAINLTGGDTRGHVGLLKEDRLRWPAALQGEAFRAGREAVSRGLPQAVRAVRSDGGRGEEAARAVRADLKALDDAVDARARTLSPDEYVAAKRYLKQVGEAVTALQSPGVSNHFDGYWAPQAQSVAELVRFMAEKGLRFAPASPGDEAAYTALYHALAAYDARTAPTPRVARADAE
jgi:hypothetical protein